tara:strand:+ start:3351 stop:3719 length:369 start_codon:yes stop_codon:yes gene_type:complete
MLRKDIEEKFPFLSVITYGGSEYVGIINNQDNFITSMYVIAETQSEEERTKLLDLGDVWWWESNRMIPINIFLRKDMENFRYCMMNMNSKDVKIIHGPTVNLRNLAVKRVKRRSVQLIKKPK